MTKKNLIDSETIGITTNGDNILLNVIYPIGSIYMSVNNTNPSTFFGGTWEQWGAGKMPVSYQSGDDRFGTIEGTGGNKKSSVQCEIFQASSTGYLDFKNQSIGAGYTSSNRLEIGNSSVRSTVENQTSGIAVSSINDSLYNLPPYIVCYMWKRVS